MLGDREHDGRIVFDTERASGSLSSVDDDDIDDQFGRKILKRFVICTKSLLLARLTL